MASLKQIQFARGNSMYQHPGIEKYQAQEQVALDRLGKRHNGWREKRQNNNEPSQNI